MRLLIVLPLLLLFTLGCGKKEPPPAPQEPTETRPKTDSPPQDATTSDRAKLLKDLKSTNQKVKREAVEELAGWVDTDPETITALLELLKDKTTVGPGKRGMGQIGSTREAAATALYWAGPKGEAALKEKGFPTLRDGLQDPSLAVVEHTAYTIGQLGPLARPLSDDVMKLCTSSDENVHGAAFDALREIGVTDVAGFIALLNNESLSIGRLAAQQVHTFTKVPDAAIPSLITALGNNDASIRVAAAAGLAAAGPKAAAAAVPLAEALKKIYPAEFNPQMPQEFGAEMVFWHALVQIGEAAVLPVTDLLTHTNPMVRTLAAQTLGRIGPPAKSAVSRLKEALKDKAIAAVSIEAAYALCAIGEGKEDAVEHIKKLIEFPDVTAKYAIEVIPRMGEAGKPLMTLALGKLGGENAFARFAAVGLVGILPPAESTKYAAELGKLTTDKVPEIRHRVGLVLEKLGKAAAPAAEAVSKAYKEEMVELIRDQFLAALIAMEAAAKPALSVLLPLVREKTLIPTQRMRVIVAIGVADPASKEVSTTLIAAAGDDDADIRAASASAIGKLDPLPPEALAKLVSIARSDKSTVARNAAIRAMAIAGPRAKSARGEMEAIVAGPQPGFALWAKVGMAAMDGDIAKSAPAIRAALTDKNTSVREAGVEALLLVGPDLTDMPVLVKLLKDRNSTTRATAARCIGTLGNKGSEAIPQLIPLLSDGTGEVRVAAAEAVGDIGEPSLPVAAGLKRLLLDPIAKAAAGKAMEKLSATDKK